MGGPVEVFVLMARFEKTLKSLGMGEGDGLMAELRVRTLVEWALMSPEERAEAKERLSVEVEVLSREDIEWFLETWGLFWVEKRGTRPPV
jgi:hypothetical protein